MLRNGGWITPEWVAGMRPESVAGMLRNTQASADTARRREKARTQTLIDNTAQDIFENLTKLREFRSVGAAEFWRCPWWTKASLYHLTAS